MSITHTFTLAQILDLCDSEDSWIQFCNDFGWGYFCVNEGLGELRQSLTQAEVRKYGIVPPGKD